MLLLRVRSSSKANTRQTIQLISVVFCAHYDYGLILLFRMVLLDNLLGSCSIMKPRYFVSIVKCIPAARIYHVLSPNWPLLCYRRQADVSNIKASFLVLTNIVLFLGYKETNEELQAALMSKSVIEGRTLLNNTNNNSLAAEFEAMSENEVIIILFYSNHLSLNPNWEFKHPSYSRLESP